jgi:serine/threonine protein phosphatase PrpC
MFSAARSGTTVTFVIIDGWVVTVASVGDSRCILESAEGTVYFLSADHRLDANEEEYVYTPTLSFILTVSLGV